MNIRHELTELDEIAQALSTVGLHGPAERIWDAIATIDTLCKSIVPDPKELEVSTVELELPTRTLNGLKSWGILTVGQLVELSEEELLQIGGIWKKGVQEIKNYLDYKGLRLRGSNS